MAEVPEVRELVVLLSSREISTPERMRRICCLGVRLFVCVIGFWFCGVGSPAARSTCLGEVDGADGAGHGHADAHGAEDVAGGGVAGDGEGGGHEDNGEDGAGVDPEHYVLALVWCVWRGVGLRCGMGHVHVYRGRLHCAHLVEERGEGGGLVGDVAAEDEDDGCVDQVEGVEDAHDQVAGGWVCVCGWVWV